MWDFNPFLPATYRSTVRSGNHYTTETTVNERLYYLFIMCCVSVHWCRNSNGLLTFFTFWIRYLFGRPYLYSPLFSIEKWYPVTFKIIAANTYTTDFGCVLAFGLCELVLNHNSCRLHLSLIYSPQILHPHVSSFTTVKATLFLHLLEAINGRRRVRFYLICWRGRRTICDSVTKLIDWCIVWVNIRLREWDAGSDTNLRLL